MTLRGNKGEWSEVYAFLKLLGEGKVYAGDQNLNKIQDLFYPIIMILRQEKQEAYNYMLQDKLVVVQTPNGEELLRIPADRFLEEAEKLLAAINKNEGSFALPQIETFLNSLYCYSLKAKSTDKTDIKIILHDRRTNINSEMGFSIKSQIGGDSSLLNASKSTNFNYKIVGAELTDNDIEQINAINPSKNKVIERVKAIRKNGGTLVFDKVDNQTFSNNLRVIDGELQEITAHLLLEQLNTGISSLQALSERLSEINPLHYDMTQIETPYYACKIKRLLTAVVLGMMPATPWNCRYEANGGYIVVKRNGDILCYHFYDRNRFEDFLFNNAYLERSSTTKHDYAKIIKNADGSLSFKINFQVRLI